MTEDLTGEEKLLVMLYSGGNRTELIAELTDMRTYLGGDEQELRELTDSVIGKVSRMSDRDFGELDLFGEEEV